MRNISVDRLHCMYAESLGSLRFHYDNDYEYENEIFVCYLHFLSYSWVPIRYRCSRRPNGSDESFIALCTKT